MQYFFQKNMHCCFLLSICLFVMGSDGLAAEDNEVKQGTYPFMALVYYSDDTKLENGKRFTRNAILIQPQWLVSSTIDVNENSTFPRKTLLARAGAVSIDANLTLNEDESEQEREIVQVVHPSNINQREWWFYDISLLKTLIPFKITSQVAITNLPNAQDYREKTCYIVIYGNKYANTSDLRILMQLPVQIQAPEACGSYFKKDNMICSANYDPKKFSYDSDFCERNSGGPLICEDTVVGLQTYVNECKEPYLHLLLAAWRDYIQCGIEEQCQTNACNGVCTAFDKDSPVTTTLIDTTLVDTTLVDTTLSDTTLNDTTLVDTTLVETTLIETSISTIIPNRRSFTSLTENSPQVFNEIKETTTSLTMAEIKDTSETVTNMYDGDTTATSTEIYTSVPSISTSENTSRPIEIFVEVKSISNVTGDNVTITHEQLVTPRPKPKLRRRSSRKSQASINTLKASSILLAFFILATFV